MGQCTSKPNDDKSSLSLGGRNSIVRNSENRFRLDHDDEVEHEEDEEEGRMSPEDVKGRRPVVRRKDSLLKQQEDNKKGVSSQNNKKNSVNKGRKKSSNVGGDKTLIERKESNKLLGIKKDANSYKYCDPNASFLVHDVVKRGICETFVIDFDTTGVEKKPKKRPPPPPNLTRPKPSTTPSSSPSIQSTPSSSPSANVKSRNEVNNRKFLSGKGSRTKKQEKDFSNKVIKSIENNNSPVQNVKVKQNLLKKHQTKNKKDEGRIHSAVVSGINIDSRSVTVEWFERGEAKGKEIELDAILNLNHDLAPQNDNSNGIPNKLSKYVPRPSMAVAAQQQQQQQNNRATSVNSAAAAVSAGPGSNMRTRNNKGRPTMNLAEPPVIQQQPPPPIRQQQLMPPPPQPQPPPQQDDDSSQNDPGKGGARGARRSNVVNEVERLKKNREERRAKQKEIMEEKVAQKNVDPGNPNWEFLTMIREYQEQVEFNPLQDGDAVVDHQITVCVRKRPLNKKEKARKEVDVVTIPNRDQTIVHEPKTKVDLTKYLDNQHFRFDYAFDETTTNELVYKYTARPLVQNIFEGGMATCFAYGQTGSGKTHTMGGEFHGKSQDSKNGIYALATKDVFKFLHAPKYKNLKLSVSCSYFEIYSGKVFDLLSGKAKLRVLEDGKQQVVIVGLVEKTVDSVEDVLKLINLGNNVRTSGQTSANAHSSRSHAVFQIILRHGAKKSLYGKFSLIDLAGNERGADTSSANRQTRMEGAEINKSLLALKECIRALGRKGAHLPFRASKLTQVLRDSFIGEKSKTCMIAMISPGLSSCEHSLNTLRYADRVKELGAEDPTTLQKASPTDNGLLLDEDSMRLDDGVLSPEDSDLAQLRSLNDTELSADWYNFQEAVSHLQELEEDLVDSHRNLIVNMQQWASDDAALLSMTNEVDYDQDAYCQQLEEMINEKLEAFLSLREKARNFRDSQIDEEAKSRLLTRRN